VHFVTFFLVIVWGIKLVIAFFGEERLEFKFSFIDIPVLGFFIWALVLTLGSDIPQASREEFLKILNYVLVYYLIVVNLKQKQIKSVALTIVIVGCAIATYGVVQKLQGAEGLIYNTISRPEQYASRVSGTYICPNHFSGYLEMALSLCLGLLLFSSLDLGWKLLLGYAGLLMGAGIFLSISRGGYLSMAGAGALLFILALLKKKFRSLLIFVLIAILLSSAVIFLNKDTILPRWKTVFAEAGSPAGRIHFWKGALEIIKNNPVFGTGPGTFKWYFPRYRHPKTVLDLNYAHNGYLHYAADYGVIGLGLILLFFIALFARGFSLLEDDGSRNRGVVAGVLAATVALLIHSVFDFNFHIPANAVTFVVLAGLMRAGNLVHSSPRIASQRDRQSTAHSHKIVHLMVGVGLVLIVLVAAPVSIRHYLADKEYRKGLAYEKEIRWSEALRHFARAAKIDGDNFLYPAKMADLYLNKSRFKKEKKSSLESALKYSKETIRLNPQYASQYLTRGLIYEGLKENENAEIAYTQALELDPKNAYYHQALGLFYLREGKKEKAEVELEKSRKIKESALTGKLLRKLK